MKQYRKVQPCGMLFSQGRKYFLLHPEPIAKSESWERDNAYRWVVVPIAMVSKNKFPFARHIVATAFVVEYSPNMPEIEIEYLGELDVSNMEWIEVDEYLMNTRIDDEPKYMEHLLDNVDQYNGEGLA